MKNGHGHSCDHVTEEGELFAYNDCIVLTINILHKIRLSALKESGYGHSCDHVTAGWSVLHIERRY